jgi:hypothetical protein
LSTGPEREAEVARLLGPLLTRIRTRSNQGYLDRLQRGRSWIIAADHYRDDRDIQFTCYWIALNAMFGGFAAPEQTRVSSAAAPSALDFVDREILEFMRRICDLDQEGLISARVSDIARDGNAIIRDKWHFKPYWAAGTTPPVENSLRLKVDDLRSALRSRRYPDYLAILLSRIQDIRNHVLHGASTYAVSKNRESVERATTVLKVLVPTFAEIMERPEAEMAFPWPRIAKPRERTPQNPDSGR